MDFLQDKMFKKWSSLRKINKCPFLEATLTKTGWVLACVTKNWNKMIITAENQDFQCSAMMIMEFVASCFAYILKILFSLGDDKANFVTLKKYLLYSEVSFTIFVQKVKMNESMTAPKLSSLMCFVFKLFWICESLYFSWKLWVDWFMTDKRWLNGLPLKKTINMGERGAVIT